MWFRDLREVSSYDFTKRKLVHTRPGQGFFHAIALAGDRLAILGFLDFDRWAEEGTAYVSFAEIEDQELRWSSGKWRFEGKDLWESPLFDHFQQTATGSIRFTKKGHLWVVHTRLGLVELDADGKLVREFDPWKLLLEALGSDAQALEARQEGRRPPWDLPRGEGRPDLGKLADCWLIEDLVVFGETPGVLLRLPRKEASGLYGVLLLEGPPRWVELPLPAHSTQVRLSAEVDRDGNLVVLAANRAWGSSFDPAKRSLEVFVLSLDPETCATRLAEKGEKP